ncbi:hypothetical protein RhiJN_10977 [Ceratobasidium sp. AG-Ba]|nr:hypothetical protein RhiJN_10977 [Ceratobasidium sp. AG-Ba]
MYSTQYRTTSSTQCCEPPDLRTWTPESLEARISSTRFLFRVFDSSTEANYSKQKGFVAEAVSFDSPIGDLPIDLFEAVANHVGQVTDLPSKWISTTRRWDWAVWEMARRYHNAPLGNIRVAVIDLHAIPQNSMLKESSYGGRIIHALQLLNYPVRNWSSSRFSHWTRKQNTIFDLQNYSNSSDEVLFYERIPAAAIISVVSFRSIRPYIPCRNFLSSWLDENSYRSAYSSLRKSYHNIQHKANDIIEDHLAFTLYLLRPVYNDILGLLQSSLAKSSPIPSELNVITPSYFDQSRSSEYPYGYILTYYLLLLDTPGPRQGECQHVVLQTTNYGALSGVTCVESHSRGHSGGAGNHPQSITISDVPDNFRSAWPLIASQAIEAQSRLNLLNQVLGYLAQAPVSRKDNESYDTNDNGDTGIFSLHIVNKAAG